MTRVYGLVALVLLVLGVGHLHASGDGYGYQRYSDGFYYYNGGSMPYSKSWVAPYTDPYGCYVYGHWSYVAYSKPAYTAPSYTPTAAPAYSPNWKTELIGAIKKETARRGNLDDYAAYQQALMTLGLGNYFAYPPSFVGGGIPATTGGYNSILSSAGVQGNTVYGYGQQTSITSYGNIDVNSLLQQYGRTVENAQTLAGQAQTDLTGVVRLTAADAARIAEMQIKAALVRAVEPQPRTQTDTRTFQFRVGPDGKLLDIQPVGPQAPAPGAAPPASGITAQDIAAFQALPSVVGCSKCHADKGGAVAAFNISRFHPRAATEAEKLAIGRYASGASKCTGAKLEIDALYELLTGLSASATKGKQ